MTKKFRLVTRSDFDGLVSAVLLKELGIIDEITFVHPKDMQDGKIQITSNDITTNLPYVEGVHLAFDHHLSETIRVHDKKDNHILDPNAPSAARVVFNHYGGEKAFGKTYNDMMDAVDKGDSAEFTREDILNPKGWVLMNFIMDARTGLGRFRQFTVSNYELMMKLIDFCRNKPIEEVLELRDVKERTDLFFEHAPLFKDQLQRCSRIYKNLVVVDLRQEDTIYAGNRFMVYALYPEVNISMHIIWGLKKQNTVFAIGKSIFNRTSKTNIGELMLRYDGGGHMNAGTCQIDNEKADTVFKELVDIINKDG